ncbi:hypothetical protein E2562_005201 [Oryza meyeriana var. granulata]|uniref:Uncharacterized protein n=1 Tax=Oryza meyeriana var. granulata TaxID=110450 RepID=A0A6G1BTC7_9ORYZ|nr:hypothetical protein E2562_005201 [Oryza meyeriana var. granulata]
MASGRRGVGCPRPPVSHGYALPSTPQNPLTTARDIFSWFLVLSKRSAANGFVFAVPANGFTRGYG